MRSRQTTWLQFPFPDRTTAKAKWFSSDNARTFSVDSGNNIPFVNAERPPRRLTSFPTDVSSYYKRPQTM
ncbi:hypothetical protein BCCH1_51010 [Burkholderia contaminans]|jgi:hypothetical protein|uniref:Uncharacterized protein n=1 Tax=Burkholderia contaminans TaxID=488447 RepID=A0A250LDI9_9BURK|nr:hypothetical protein BCCH1_51010 [Burkholderia contaminans]GLZ68844.1 hypothetical protein Bcon01_18890 [Burkholderia contaminans]